MSEEEEKVEGEWRRIDLGNDMEAWEWALGQMESMTIVPVETNSGDGPRVRPLTVVRQGESYFILTGTGDTKVSHLRADPRFEYYVLVKEGESPGYVRFHGVVEFVEQATLRKEVAEASGFSDNYWSGPDDPDMSILRLDIRQAEVMRPGVKGYELLSR